VTTKTVFACAAVVCVAAALGAADARDIFGVGVLRRDGVLIPFATFDGRRWRNAWPVPHSDPVVPASLADVPKRWWGPAGPIATWHAMVTASERPIRVTQPDWVDVHCARHLALRTDYATGGAVPAQAEQPYPKDGLAASQAGRVERIEDLAPTALELQAVAPVVWDAFNRAERETASRSNHPMPRSARELVQPAFEAVYAYGASPRFYYVEAIRAYRMLGQPPDECVASAFGTGWFVREGATIRSLLMFVDVLPCNRTGASYMLPLGVVRSANRLFWMAQFSGWDHERYAVLELTAKKIEVMVSTWGGGC
jgi:hypothetical protein